MTNPTPHGQVPEALRLADALYDGSYLLSVERYNTADELRRLHAYCQELEAQVIRDCMTHVQNPAEIEHVAGDVSKNVAESHMAQQAAPKAAPGEQFDSEGFRAWVRQNLPDETIIGDAAWWAAHLTEWAQRFVKAAPQQDAQEPAAYVHVPHYTVEGKVRPVVSFEKYQQDYADGIYSTRIPLYTAPQPAPAPLSEMPYEKRKAIQEGEQIGASDAWFKARHEMLDTVDRRNVFRAGFDRGWSAALAAQGGK